jgi:hypothetical protein
MSSQTSPSNKGAPTSLPPATESQTLPTATATPRTGASTGSGMSAFDSMPIVRRPNNFVSPPIEPSARGGPRTSGEGPSQVGSDLGTWSVGTGVLDHVNPNISYMDMNATAFQSTHSHGFPSSRAVHGVPLTLQVPVPDPAGPPVLTSSSSWYSPDSTQSTEPKFFGNFPRDRSSSVATIHEWEVWADQFGEATLQTPQNNLRPSQENYESPPYVDSFSPLLPLQHGGGSSFIDGYSVELVGTPTPVMSLFRPYTQSFSASTPRASNPEFPIFSREQYPVVDTPYIGSSPTGVTPNMPPMDDCVALYRAYVEPLFSIIHPQTYNIYQNSLVKHAMAALGSQFFDRPEHRQAGISFHRACNKIIMAQVCFHWASGLRR